MIKYNVSKKTAELYKALIQELRPNWDVQVAEIDYNLYKLGFVDDIPSCLLLECTEKQIEELYDEIINMEIEAFIQEDLLLKSPLNLTEEEQKTQRELKELKKQYHRYSQLEGIFLDILNKKET